VILCPEFAGTTVVLTLWLRWSFSSGMSELGFKLFFDPHALGLAEIFLLNLFRIVERFCLQGFP
jgi:hypothetical protein